MSELQFRFEQDRSSGRIHKRYADEYGRFELTRERCQRDQSGSYEVVERDSASSRSDGLPDRLAQGLLCKYDFSEGA
jgi:hypothetical protein